MKKQIFDFDLDKYISTISKDKIDNLYYRFCDEYWKGMLINNCESPIEQMLYLHLLIDQPEDMGISTQVKVYPMGDFRRLDFLISLTTARGNRNRPLFVIETDGSLHNDEEKVMDDKIRDRLIMQDLGLMVVRFTGKEVVRDAESCAWEVKELFYSFKDNLTQSIFTIPPLSNPLSPEYQESYESYRKKVMKKRSKK